MNNIPQPPIQQPVQQPVQTPQEVMGQFTPAQQMQRHQAPTQAQQPLTQGTIPTNVLNFTTQSTVQHEVEMLEKIKSFEREAINPSNKGFKTGFKLLDKGLMNLQTGFHIIAGDSNMGKTGFLSQLAWQVSQLNDDVIVLDFSLDDAIREKMPRVVACNSNIIINSVKNPGHFLQYPDMLKRRAEGLSKLANSIDRYVIYDSSTSCFIEDIEDTIKKVKISLAENGIKKRVCVFIDNFHDLNTTSPEAKGSDKAKYDYLAQKVSDLATELDSPIVCTAEFRKINGFRRPSVDDLRESVKIKYEAKSILLIYNEVSLKGEAAQIYFNLPNRPEKQPVFEVKFGKNKYSSFKGRGYYYFFPEMSKFEECPDDQTKTFNNLLYSG